MDMKSKMLSLMGGKGSEWLVPVAAVGTVFVMIVPLPAIVIDLLLAASITASVLVLLVALQIQKPVQFSVFPSLLLLLTLFRLSLDLASSRRILLHGNEGASAAGSVIAAFGQFVVGGNYVVGFVLFLALIAIQYLVVSHGAVRTAEVTARFTLDAMPGKQMAIDADLNAGLIEESQARSRREQIAREAEFYGAMDGAARFSQRDSMATILITAINIIAGFLVGVFQHGTPFQQALRTYTVLTVGDGLVKMIPSLLVSVAGAIVLTRASSQGELGSDIGQQLLGKARTLWIGAGVMLCLALIPGLPKLSFGLMSLLLVMLARRSAANTEAIEQAAAASAESKPKAAASTSDGLDSALKLDDMMLEVGAGLIPLVDSKQGGQLLGKIRSLRKQLAQQLGFLVPSIHITDNLALREREYVVYLRGVEVARWEMRRDLLLAVSSQPSPQPIPGEETREPAFNSAARWISPDMQPKALAAGYVVVDHTAALATHLSEIIKQNSYELLTRHETKRLIDLAGEAHPKLVEELIPKLMTLGEVQRILQQLLREQVSIRDLGTILETLVEAAAINKNPVLLVEAVRHSLGRALVRPLLNDKGELKVVTLDRAIEEECIRALTPQTQMVNPMALQPSTARRVIDGLRSLLGEQGLGAPPVILCSSPGRFYLRRLLEPFLPKIVVLAPTEIPAIVPVQSIGAVR
ncbi:MAG TPA: flagellar biosynthesis protein FlhA [Terriglobales bacterium]|nr:flagellar biosynthesis protein FlhA [Terriglobales bacterium]